MSELKITIKTLTPLWTGDVNGKCDELKLTGIIGSLRWWFEALVRGMGYYACDSTNDQCEISVKNPEDVLNIREKICPVCYLFGTTGWKSRFSVQIEEDQLTPLYNGKVVVKLERRKREHKGWHYEAGLWGSTKIRFTYREQVIGETDKGLVKLSDVFPSILKILLYLIGEYGMLGAKTSMGYGVVSFKVDDKAINITEGDRTNFKNYLSLFDGKFKRVVRNLPSLKDMFFVKFKVDTTIDNLINGIKSFYRYQEGMTEADVNKWKNNDWCITAPVVRNCLRCIFRGKYSDRSCRLDKSCERNYWWNKDRNQTNRSYDASKTIDILGLSNGWEVQNIRHFLMGSTKEPEFSSIQVSHVYKNSKDELEFRIYGWLPDIKPINGKVNGILKLLSSLFKDVQRKDYVPSHIQNGICWDGTKLDLVNDNVKDLFIKGKEG